MRESGLDISSSTVRNIMADLEARGLVRSPHTSAGRIPTNKGYRLFVDHLLTVKSPNEQNLKNLVNQIAPGRPLKNVAESVSNALSGLTRLAGLVMVPGSVPRVLRHIEFLGLNGQQVLAIVVVNESEVQNLIIDTPRKYSESELVQASNYLNEKFAGKTLSQVRSALLREMRRAREQMADMMQDAISMADRVFEQKQDDADCVISGQTNLMAVDDLANIDTLRGLFEAFNEKRGILSLLDHAVNGQGVQIFIGEESGYSLLNDCALITSPYEVEGEVLGAVGVVGPTRMSYDEIIPIVDVTARLVSAALNPALNSKDRPI